METYNYHDLKILEEKNSLYKKLLFQSPDLIFQFSISVDGRLTFPFMSKSVITHFDLQQEEKSKDAYTVLRSKIHPDDFSKFLKSIQEAKSKLKDWNHEFRAILPEKGLRWFSGSASLEKDDEGTVHFFGKITDVTHFKEQELKLKLSEERFLFALEASSEGIWDLDVASNKVFYSSQSMKMLEFDAKDRVDSINLWDDRVHPEDKNRYLTDIQLHIDRVTPYYENAQRVMANSGEYKWILSRGKIIQRDENDKPLRIIGTHTDISAQKEKEEDMIRTLGIIGEQNSRLLNFAHIVSHNLRSHSGNIEMLLNIIAEETDEDFIKESFNHLRTSSKSLSQTIEHLKELVEIQSDLVQKKENLNLSAYLGKTLDVLAEEIKSNKVIIQNKVPEQETIVFNPAYLESILLNFTSNAIRYAHPDRTPVISYSMTSNKYHKILEIEDNGLGINLERHGKKLFGMYKTFHKHKDSRGIGLFITKNQIEAMGGKVDVSSQVGIGTTFKIYFNE
ncbi:PAS domain-containing protein [Flavobacterium sp. CYK-4]|uniref:PAS domain-containing sensor histidine kinase n=1 Tax=Flavobacterium lotistagni TaxID=2709660 RepID=UPI00140E52D1|nr:HAMP domain-containing sensor histidine kinase [Flavobacterium lotistagni]NHM07298.1 PAS domain-containing protein [Flavobacterium lotistagni]